MKTTIILIAAAALTGCANYQANLARMQTPEFKDCEYKAMAATPPSNSAMADAFRQVELTNMCMRMKGM